ADGLVKKLVSINAWPIPSYFFALQDYLPRGSHCALLMVAEGSLTSLRDLVKEFAGEVTYEKTAQEAKKCTSLAEYTWNHTTLHARSTDPNLTYLQSAFPYDPQLTLVKQMYEHFGGEVMIHLEFMRSQGKAIATGLQIVRYTTPGRLEEIITYHEDQGIFIANPHTYILEDGGRKTIDPEQLAFKKLADPYGLMNPGKMRAWPSS
ncbi:MAG: FAD-binding oxidoreductase, partial [Okeania sp. SIO2D1]|nr:FAD-binding oxidoreductase [Okeania sp. SIO2D1]